MIKILACSERIVANMMGPPQRGLVHSAFSSASNLLFADGFLLALNSSPARPTDSPGTLMPNGLLLSARPGAWPFTALKAGMPIILGAGQLVLEALPCSLDGTYCPRWNPHIERPPTPDFESLRNNARWLAQFCQSHRPPEATALLAGEEHTNILTLAEKICGRGPGLTPGGDDFLAGWMAAGWLLYGPQPAFLATCQHITTIARQRTHALSQCWLNYAASGDVASPISSLLAALYNLNQKNLEQATRNTLALGATSGYDLVQGILHGIEQFPLF